MSDSVAPFDPIAIAGLLEATATIVQAEVSALPDAALRWHRAPGEWCVKEVLGHLIEAEGRGFAGRIQTILDADEPALAGWDQAQVARDRRDCERDAGDLLAEFLRRRAAGVSLVRSLAAGDLQRGGHHPEVGHLRIADLLQEWAYHDREHLRQALTAVQVALWPHLGNARRFYEG